jgi:hypothetical protein
VVKGPKSAREAAKLLREAAKQHGCTAEQMPGRGKSHTLWVLHDAEGEELA